MLVFPLQAIRRTVSARAPPPSRVMTLPRPPRLCVSALKLRPPCPPCRSSVFLGFQEPNGHPPSSPLAGQTLSDHLRLPAPSVAQLRNPLKEPDSKHNSTPTADHRPPGMIPRGRAGNVARVPTSARPGQTVASWQRVRTLRQIPPRLADCPRQARQPKLPPPSSRPADAL